MGSELEKMIAGEMYDPYDAELQKLSLRAKQLYYAFNNTPPDAPQERQRLLAELLGAHGSNLEIVPPFYCDYGFNIRVGDSVFMNMNCVILDIMPVTIGSRTMLGPNVQIYAATHPMDPVERASGREYAKPVVIGEDVWVGGGAIVNPGVTIGNAVVIGSGAVVTRDLPDRVFAGGNPARIIREI